MLKCWQSLQNPGIFCCWRGDRNCPHSLLPKITGYKLGNGQMQLTNCWVPQIWSPYHVPFSKTRSLFPSLFHGTISSGLTSWKHLLGMQLYTHLIQAELSIGLLVTYDLGGMLWKLELGESDSLSLSLSGTWTRRPRGKWVWTALLKGRVRACVRIVTN